MKRFLIPIVACAFTLIAGCSPPAEERADAQFTVAPFTLTNQDNQPFGTEQLKGKTWIACLFFSECSGPCPMMTARLRDIQKAVDDPNVILVSVSCDPAKDTPDTLKQYAKKAGAKDGRWYFLTGTPEQVKQVANDRLKLGFDPATPTQPIMHATKFLLIDGSAGVRGIYDTEDDASMTKLKADAKKLAHSK